MARRNQTLYRDPKDKMLGGVASGLAQYFDIDTMLVRVAFIAVAAVGGGGLIGYLILWAMLPEEPASTPPPIPPMPANQEIVLDSQPQTPPTPTTEIPTSETVTSPGPTTITDPVELSE